MSICKRDIYHGAALSKIVGYQQQTTINSHPNFDSKNAYLLNNYKGIYIKYTTVPKRDKKWQFTFNKTDINNIRRLFEFHEGQTYVLLICNEEEICLIDYNELISCIDLTSNTSQIITINKPPRKSFRINGSKGEYEKPIPINSFPDKLFL